MALAMAKMQNHGGSARGMPNWPLVRHPPWQFSWLKPMANDKAAKGDSMVIRSIKTRYKGCQFRSRLEARWAVFFDALNIIWEYEKEGFRLSDGTLYLPDFWL